VDVFPAWETLPLERVSPSVDTMGRRLRAMWRLRDPGRMPRVLIASVRALVQRLGPHVEEAEPVVVKPGDVLDPTDLVERLIAAGYRREYQVEHRGEVAVRGSIVDVFPSTADVPVRIDLWGDEVDRLTEFSVADQRSTVDVECAELFPCRELLPTDEVRERASKLIAREPWGREQWERLADGATSDGKGSGARVAATLRDNGLSFPLIEEGEDVDLTNPGGQVVVAPLERGFVLANAKLAVLAESDVTGRRRAHRRPRPRRTDAQGFFEDLQPGDYVVHHQHGVARYGGMVKRALGGAERDYLLLEDKGGDKLYVPSDQLDPVR